MRSLDTLLVHVGCLSAASIAYLANWLASFLWALSWGLGATLGGLRFIKLSWLSCKRDPDKPSSPHA